MVSFTTGLMTVSLMFLNSAHSLTTTENTTAPTTAGWTTPGDSTGNTKVQALAGLKEDILSRPIVKQKVPPLRTSASGADQPVEVNVSVLLGSIVSVDDSRQMLTSAVMITVQWTDPSLAWSPEDHGGVVMVEVGVDSVWTPLVFITNSADFGHVLSHAHFLTVLSDGTVTAVTTIMLTTMCSMDHTKFPFDTQVCSVIVAGFSSLLSIHMDAHFLDPALSSVMIQKSNWEVVSLNHTSVPFMPDVYVPAVRMELRRRTMFYVVCLVTPMVLTSYMNTLVFLVPVQSGEKVSFLVSIFVSTSVFISFFTSVMPPSLDTLPSTMKLLLGVIVESLAVLLATVLVMRRYHGEQARLEAVTASALPSRPTVHSAHKTSDAAPAAHRREGRSCLAKSCSSRLVRVIPATPDAGTNEPQGVVDKAVVKPAIITASSLDRIFFTLSFVANTVFLCVLYFE